ncbi:MAG: branched-chain amino acid ABC transporter permease [Actinomycetota bacterium]|jgi:urea transport system permease protein|nr:MAG: branched-chain amino acid ABC transporter permease [Actinomycetota bacterium]
MTTVLNGLTLAAVLSLVAIGLAVIFGLMRVINMAHGEMFILGSYTVVAAWEATGNVWLGIALAPFVVGAIGWAIERTMIRRLSGRLLDTLVATWGLSIVIREGLKVVFGAGSRNLPFPFTGDLTVLGTRYPLYRLFLIALAVVVMATVLWVFLRTDFGWKVSAVTQDREMAMAMGIDAGRIDAAVFALGAGLAGLAGAVMTPLITLNPEVGLFFLARSFLVVIVGGVGSLLGTAAGAGLIGMGQAALAASFRPVIAQIVLLVLAIVIIRLRPTGLFGRLQG